MYEALWILDGRLSHISYTELRYATQWKDTGAIKTELLFWTSLLYFEKNIMDRKGEEWK
jgi:hypothetical protein